MFFRSLKNEKVLGKIKFPWKVSFFNANYLFKKNLGKERGKISILNLKGVHGSTKRFIDFCKKK